MPGVKRGETKKNFKCPRCKKDLKKQDAFDKHMKYIKKHNECPKPTGRVQGLERPFKCRVKDCKSSFTTDKIREIHEDSHITCICPICGKRLSDKRELKIHIQKHENNPNFKPQNPDRPTAIVGGEKLYPCQYSPCTETFKTPAQLLIHEIRNHKQVQFLTSLSNKEMQILNPFGGCFPLRGMERPADPDLEKVVEWLYKWIQVRMEIYRQTTDGKGHGMYLAAVLGKKFKSGMNILDFIKKNPDQVWLYIGSDSSGSGDISIRHKDDPNSSPLGIAALLGLTVVCLYRYEEFTGDWEQRAGEMKMMESILIEMCLTDAEFSPVPGKQQYVFLNRTREQTALLFLDEDEREAKMKGIFQDVIAEGVNTLCLDKNCDKSCGSLIHSNKCVIVDMTKVTGKTNDDDDENMKDDDEEDEDEDMEKTVKGQKYPFEDGYSDAELPLKKRRPRGSILDHEVERRMKKFKDQCSKHGRTHHRYDIITLDTTIFPGKTDVQICTSVLNKEEEDISIGLYCGVNKYARKAAHHEQIPKHSSIGKDVKNSNKIPIEINVKDFPSRRLARMNESIEILQNGVQSWIKKTGIKFNPLNKKQELLHLSLNSPESIKNAIRNGLKGISSVTLKVIQKFVTNKHK